MAKDGLDDENMRRVEVLIALGGGETALYTHLLNVQVNSLRKVK